MKISEIITFLESKGDFINYQHTRDHLLIGDDHQDINQVIVCWVASLPIIKQAIQSNCHFIISHENPFYLSSTSLPNILLSAQQEKKALLKKHSISIYRCHDLWDGIPDVGVRDTWAKIMNIPFKPCQPQDYIRISEPTNRPLSYFINTIADSIQPYGETGIEVIGDPDHEVRTLGIGTGACTDVFEMVANGADTCIVSDDGINNWSSVQWAHDHHIPLIVVSHMACEAPGIKSMADFLNDSIPDVQFKFLPNDFRITHLKSKC